MRSHTDGRGADAVIDAVGMEAHGSPIAETAQTAAGFLPSPVGRAVMKQAGVDRLAALNSAIAMVRRGGTISLSGVYGGAADPINMMTLFDKQIQLRMGQANVKRWVAGHHAAAHRRRSARRRTVRHPPAAAELGARRLRDVPEEAGRHGQGGAQALTGWQRVASRRMANVMSRRRPSEADQHPPSRCPNRAESSVIGQLSVAAQRDRKRMVRLLVDDVTLHKTDRIHLHVRFRGGQTTSLVVAIPPKAWQVRQTHPDTLAALDRLLDTHTDAQTAEARSTPPVTAPARASRSPPASCSKRAAATSCPATPSGSAPRACSPKPSSPHRLDVHESTVKSWTKIGILNSHKANDKNERLYEPPIPGDPRLTARQGSPLENEFPPNPRQKVHYEAKPLS